MHIYKKLQYPFIASLGILSGILLLYVLLISKAQLLVVSCLFFMVLIAGILVRDILTGKFGLFTTRTFALLGFAVWLGFSMILSVYSRECENYSYEVVVNSILLTFTGLASFLVGYSFPLNRNLTRGVSFPKFDTLTIPLFTTTSMCYIISFIAIIMFMQSYGGGLLGYIKGQGAGVFSSFERSMLFVSRLLLPAIIWSIYLLKSRHVHITEKLILLFSIFFAFSWIYLRGDRWTVMETIIIIVGLLYLYFKIGKGKFLLAIFLLFPAGISIMLVQTYMQNYGLSPAIFISNASLLTLVAQISIDVGSVIIAKSP